jgi:uncharacterized cupin superfamily protein
MTLEVLRPGTASARLHSHSLVDEYYLILGGRGTLRMGTHAVEVETGCLVGKPVGPDLTSHFVADRGENLRILDIEVWPDPTHRAKEIVHYPDFGEVYLRGPGWNLAVPEDALTTAAELGEHYEHGYRRRKDGTWEPRDLPGAPARRDDGSSGD